MSSANFSRVTTEDDDENVSLQTSPTTDVDVDIIDEADDTEAEAGVGNREGGAGTLKTVLEEFDASSIDRRKWLIRGVVGVMVAVVIIAALLIASNTTVTQAVTEQVQQVVQQTTERLTSNVTAISCPTNSSSSSSSLDLSPAESEAAWILTGDRSAASKLSSSTKALLRHSLSSLAVTLLSIRPQLQHDLWLTDCRSYIGCAVPPKPLREEKGDTWTDLDVFAYTARNTEKSLLTRWTEFLIAPPSPDSLFHSHTSTPYYSPGELAVDQELTMQWHDHVHRLQHPADCSKANILVMDFFHMTGGFGSWSHARALAFGIGIRAGRTVVEAPGKGGYPQPYSDCTRVYGLGGCDIFLPTSSCTLPDNWRQEVAKDKAEWSASHKPWQGGSLQAHMNHVKDRRWFVHSEWQQESEQYELHHDGRRQGWDRGQLLTLDGELAPFRSMQECWWSRQGVAYLMRVKREAGERMLTMVGQSLKLAEPEVTAHNVYDYADALAPAKTHSSHWWLAMQGVKLEWQLQQLAPGLGSAMRKEVNGEVLSVEEVKAMEQTPVDLKYRVPLLGYTFIRHGDKWNEAKLWNDEVYLEMMEALATKQGMWTWYIGADDLLSPDRLLTINNAATTHDRNASLLLYTSVLLDQIEDKEHHRLAHGFDFQAGKALTDVEREGIVWRTWLEFGVAQVADVVLSTWSSNHPRMAYELMGVMSDVRSSAPFVGLDAMKEMSKAGKVPGC